MTRSIETRLVTSPATDTSLAAGDLDTTEPSEKPNSRIAELEKQVAAHAEEHENAQAHVRQLETSRQQLERAIRGLLADKQAQARSLEDRYKELAALTQMLERRDGESKAAALMRTLARLFTKRKLSDRAIRGEIELIGSSGLFDEAWYLKQYPDVAASGSRPIEHYVRYGAPLRRNPGPKFDANHYLALNPDVADAGINPLVHYVTYGKQEGRVATSCAIAPGKSVVTGVPGDNAPAQVPRGEDINKSGATTLELDMLRAENERLRAVVSEREADIESNLLQLRGVQEELENWFRRYVELKEKSDFSGGRP